MVLTKNVSVKMLQYAILIVVAVFRVPGSPHMVQWNLQMAMATLMAIPPMILYLVASRYCPRE